MRQKPGWKQFFTGSQFFGASGACFVRYDNERGKGDHRHAGGVETSYEFTDLNTLPADFERDVTNWRDEQ